MSNHCPIIFLAFANDQVEKEKYLRNLPLELKAIRRALDRAVNAGLCEVIERANLSIAEVYDVFQENCDRIAIFHFGGHANSYELLLESNDRGRKPAYSDGLIPFLASQNSLQLVFLNGCSTELQIQELIEKGIHISIGTSREIDDEIARKLAIRFFKGIGEGYSIKTSWEHAINEIKTWKGNKLRDSLLRHGAYDSSQFPWNLLIRPGSEDVQEWSLPTATNNPLFGLPAIPSNYELTDEPYRYLARFTRKDARVFFGRDQAIRRLYNLITDKESSPVILFFGQSGVGKSSLLEAGLYPRIELTQEIIYIRRNRKQGITKSLFVEIKKQFGSTLITKKDLSTFWIQREFSTGKPVLLIIDQVEEIFTRPNANLDFELRNFLEIIADIFKVVGNRPKGRIILSYRKEYHLEISNEIRSNRISFVPFSLSRFTKSEIISIVKGLESTSAHRKKYQLSIDDELPPIIANNLLKDKDTPIAPVLQIILTKLWKHQTTISHKKGTIQKYFSTGQYNEQLEKGILLEDFFHRQIHKIKDWKDGPGVEILDSGFAFDLLHYHTTTLNSAESRTREEILSMYQPWDILDDLINYLKELYLLTNTIDNKSTALAHDTLAPIVQKAIDESNKPGQRTKRILESKVLEFRLNSQTVIDPSDLDIVMHGKIGMRNWTDEENLIIKKSQENKKRIELERKKSEEFEKKSLKKQKRNALIIAFLAICVATISVLGANFYNKQSKINSIISESIRLQKIDPTKAIKKINEALKIAPNNPNVLQTRHDIYLENEFYFQNITINQPIIAIERVSNSNDLWIALDSMIILYKDGTHPIDTLKCNCDILSMAISPENKFLVAGARDETLRLWNLNLRGAPKLIKGHTQHIKDVSFSQNGEYILSAGADKIAILWNINGELIKKLKGHDAEVSRVDFSPTGDTLLTGSYDHNIRLWSREGELINSLDKHQNWIMDLQFSQDGQFIISASRDNTAKIWTKDGKLLSNLFGHQKRVSKSIFLPESNFVLTASDDKTIRIWNRDGVPLKTYRGHQHYVWDLVPDSDSDGFISVSSDGTLKFWKLHSKIKSQFKAHDRAIIDIEVSANANQIITAESGGLVEMGNIMYSSGFDFDRTSKPGPIKIWTLENNQVLKIFEEHLAGTNDIEISSSGRLLATASDDSTAIIRNLNNGDTIILNGHAAEVQSISISRKENFFVTGGKDSIAIIWSSMGTIKHILKHDTGVTSTAISPNDHFILTTCYDGSVIIWNTDGENMQTIEAHNSRILDIQYSPNGKYFLTGSQDSTAKLWNSNGENIHTFTDISSNQSGGQAVNAVSFSNSGQLILLGSEGGIVKILTIEGQEIQTINNFDGDSVHSVAFDKTDKKIIVGTDIGNVMIFDCMY